MPSIHQSTSPFSNASVRKGMGLLTLTDVQAFSGKSYDQVMRALKSGALAKPVMVSKSGLKRLWALADVEKYKETPKVPTDFCVAQTGTYDIGLALKFLALKPPKNPVGSLKNLADKYCKPAIPKRYLGMVRINGDWK